MSSIHSLCAITRPVYARHFSTCGVPCTGPATKFAAHHCFSPCIDLPFSLALIEPARIGFLYVAFRQAASSSAPSSCLVRRLAWLLRSRNEGSSRSLDEQRLRLAHLIASVLFYGLALASWLLTGTVVPWDSKNHFYAMFRFLGDALHNGEIPLWNPYHFGGHPAIADPQSLIFTPSMMLFALIAPHGLDAAFRRRHPRASFCRRGLRPWPRAALALASVRRRARGDHFHAWRCRVLQGSSTPASLFPIPFFRRPCGVSRSPWSAAPIVLPSRSASRPRLMALGRDQVAFLLCTVLAGYVVFSAVQSGTRTASICAPGRACWRRAPRSSSRF